MTIDRMTLKALVEKGSDDDLLREMMAHVASRMMDLEVESLTGAGHGERSPSRINHRNGYRQRTWETRAPSPPDWWRSYGNTADSSCSSCKSSRLQAPATSTIA